MSKSVTAGRVPAVCWALGTLWQDRQVQLLPSAMGNASGSGYGAKGPSQAVRSQLGLPFTARSAWRETRRGQEGPGSCRGKGSVGRDARGVDEERQGSQSLPSDGGVGILIGPSSSLSCEVGIQRSFLLLLWVTQAFGPLQAP